MIGHWFEAEQLASWKCLGDDNTEHQTFWGIKYQNSLDRVLLCVTRPGTPEEDAMVVLLNMRNIVSLRLRPHP